MEEYKETKRAGGGGGVMYINCSLHTTAQRPNNNKAYLSLDGSGGASCWVWGVSEPKG